MGDGRRGGVDESGMYVTLPSSGHRSSSPVTLCGDRREAGLQAFEVAVFAPLACFEPAKSGIKDLTVAL